MAVPAGNTAYFLTIPFTPTAGFAGKFIGLTIKYVCGEMNGMTLAADICGAGSAITDLTQNKSNVFSAYGAYNAANKTVTISFLGNRTAQANMTLQDIIITKGSTSTYQTSAKYTLRVNPIKRDVAHFGGLFALRMLIDSADQQYCIHIQWLSEVSYGIPEPCC
ncbi:hypothetical protein ACLBOM_13565 [Escherichia coli]